MPSHGELPIGLLEVVVAGAADDAEDLVVIGPHLPGPRRRRRWRLPAPAGGARGRRRGVEGPTLGSSGLSNLDRLWMPRPNRDQASGREGGGSARASCDGGRRDSEEREREGREGLRLAAREGREGGTRVGSGRKVREAGMESVRDQDS